MPPTGTLAGVLTQESEPTPLVVAIDGPSGSGKSSAARGVASRLGLDYLDTGAMYRAGTWLALQRGITLTDQQTVAALIHSAVVDVVTDPTAPRVSIAGSDVSAEIRRPEVSAAVSAVATNLAVRGDLIRRQRAIIARSTGPGRRGIVVEGRDITSVVAPDAEVRVLLVADADARVARRQAELGTKVHQADVVDQVVRRDRDDSTVASFQQATDGVRLVDSTHLDLGEVVTLICELAEQARPTPAVSGEPRR